MEEPDIPINDEALRLIERASEEIKHTNNYKVLHDMWLRMVVFIIIGVAISLVLVVLIFTIEPLTKEPLTSQQPNIERPFNSRLNPRSIDLIMPPIAAGLAALWLAVPYFFFASYLKTRSMAYHLDRLADDIERKTLDEISEYLADYSEQ